MNMTPSNKDVWSKIESLGKGILIPVAIGILALVASIRLSELSASATNADRDVAILREFHQLYYVPQSRRLAVHLIRNISDYQLREQLRQFAIWDTLERQVMQQKKESGEVKFDSEEQDWHLLGDIVFAMFEDNPERAREIWAKIENVTVARWHNFADELHKLYAWTRAVYLKDWM